MKPNRLHRDQFDGVGALVFYWDLSPYVYRAEMVGALNVGWLGWRNPFFSRGPVSPVEISRLKELALLCHGQMRGYHACPFCLFRSGGQPVIRVGSREFELGSAEIIVTSLSGETYVAPNLIIHYIDRHSYRPPQEFLDALMPQSPG
ncbi:hypothetical protein AB0L47_36320 [Streptomyces bobili]|uniref:DUF7919 family protein n=1 Tax=Streptomyces bobili TaxID=67280 RepID=UPI00343B3B7A